MEHTINFSIITNFVGGNYGPTNMMLRNFKWSNQFSSHFEELAQLVTYLDVKLPFENEMTFECRGSENQLLKFQNTLSELISTVNSRIQRHFMAAHSTTYVELLLIERSITCAFCEETRKANLSQLTYHVKDKHLQIILD